MKNILFACILTSSCYGMVTAKNDGTYTVNKYGDEFSYDVDQSFQRKPTKEQTGTGPQPMATPESLLDCKGASHW